MNSYSNLDIAISICRHIPLYQLYNFRNECSEIEKEITKVLKPSRQKVLRGYYLMTTLNNSIDKKSDTMLEEASNNAVITGIIKSLQGDFFTSILKLKNDIERTYRTTIDINQESDAQILSRFRNEPKAEDLIYLRNISNQANESTLIPINLTQSNMSEIAYNNRRIEGNMSSLKKNAEKLSNALSLSNRQKMIKNIINKAIDIYELIEEEGLGNYIQTHTNDEVKEWLYGRIS